MATTEVTNSLPATEDASKKRKSQVDEIEVDLSLPEPPSKKAKRLLKKGKPLPVKPSSDDEGDGLPPSKAKSGKADKAEKRSTHGVWIGNLPFTVTRKELFQWLIESSGGAITEDNIARVNLPVSKANGKPAWRGKKGGDDPAEKLQNKGFAYVDFDTEAPAVAAMALTEAEINGRKVLIKDSKSFEGRPKKEEDTKAVTTAENNGETPGTAKKATTTRKVFVGNLSFAVVEDDLYTNFEKCGEIEWAKLATFEDTGKCKGYGWVKFREAEAAEAAVKGFVKIKEVQDTEEDFMDLNFGQEDGEEKPEKKVKMRKWWVNRLKGREIKIQFAEDDQSRYKKRFSKDGASKKFQRNGGDAGAQDSTAAEGGNAESKGKRTKKPEGYGDSKVASYLTGAVAKPEGKKVTFD